MPLVDAAVFEAGLICGCICPDLSSGFPDFPVGLVW